MRLAALGLVVALGILPSSVGNAQFTRIDLVDEADGFQRIRIGNEDYGYFLSTAKWATNAIRVCWENVDPAYATHRELVRASVAESWEKHSRIRFTEWSQCPKNNFTGIRITVADENPRVVRLGAGISNKKPGMILNFAFGIPTFSACRSSTKMYTLCIKSIAVHEFGHALGLSHEQNRNDAKANSCFKAPNGADGDTELTAYDPKSVMNYCNPEYGNHGILSDLDIVSIQAVYGANE